MKFVYKGKDSSGTPVVETAEAADRFAVYDLARSRGHTIESVEEERHFSARNLMNMERINAFLSRVKLDELIVFSRNLSAMLKAGLSISRALQVSERQTRNPRMRRTLRDLSAAVTRGEQFHEALAHFPKVFSPLYVSMVRAGEEGGSMADSLLILSEQLERASTLKKKVRGAMIYPAIVICIMAIIGVLMMIYVVPTLTKTFTELNADLPFSTKLIIGVSNFLTNHSLLALAAAVSVFAGFVMLLRTRAGRGGFEWLLLHLPVIKTIVREVNAARTARTLASLLSSGVEVVSAIKITTDVVQNTRFKAVLADAAVRVEKGRPLAEAFGEREDLYPVLVGEMMAVGEETGQVAPMLAEIATFFEGEVERKTKDLSTVIEPILMVVIGGGVGFFALAMIAPIYSISDSIK